MSFVQLPSKTKAAGKIQAGAGERKKKKKPEWDSTLNDLSVHKASPEEVMRRKEAHQSKNHETVQMEKLRKKIARARVQGRSPGGAMRRQRQKQNALLREVLFDQSQVNETLVRSDKVMSVVRDLFGDDPKKFRGMPNVTSAPSQGGAKGTLMDSSLSDEPSHLDMLSDAHMDKTALNDLCSDSDEYEDEEEETEENAYKTQFDFDRFQRFLAEAEKDKTTEQRLASLAERAAKTSTQPTSGKDKPSKIAAKSTDDGSFIEHTPDGSPQTSAMNDTLRVERVRAQETDGKQEHDSSQLANHATRLADLNAVLENLDANIADYERLTGRPLTKNPSPTTFSGYTLSLVNAVSKLTAYLKESERRLVAETMCREQLTSDVKQLNNKVDALTLDVITTQEHYMSLLNHFYRYKKDTDQELASIKSLVGRDMFKAGLAQPTKDVPQGKRSSKLPANAPVRRALMQSPSAPIDNTLLAIDTQRAAEPAEASKHSQAQAPFSGAPAVAPEWDTPPTDHTPLISPQIPSLQSYPLPSHNQQLKISIPRSQSTFVPLVSSHPTSVPTQPIITPMPLHQSAPSTSNQNAPIASQALPNSLLPHQSAFTPPDTSHLATNRADMQRHLRMIEEEKEEAERKLAELLRLQAAQDGASTEPTAGVSPSISPIAAPSEAGPPSPVMVYGPYPAPTSSWLDPTAPQVNAADGWAGEAARTITVSVPRVPSDTTPPEPPHNKVKSRRVLAPVLTTHSDPTVTVHHRL